MRQWYQELFVNYAAAYDQQEFTKGTVNEVNFIETEIGGDKSKTILDIGCGTGRHAVELARRGYRVTGVDLSADQLARARNKAAQAGVEVEFLQKDARDFTFPAPFEVVIMICEGAFPLMETDEMNFAILQNAARALQNHGRLIFTTLNALFPLHHSVEHFINANAHDLRTLDNAFDLLTFREYSTLVVVDDSGREKQLHCNERYYTPPEITWLLKSLDFGRIEIFGCQPGNFSRDRALTKDDYEMLVLAQK